MSNVSKETNHRILMALAVSLLLHVAFLMKQGLTSSTGSVSAGTTLNVRLTSSLAEVSLPSPQPEAASLPESFQSPKIIEKPKKIEKQVPIPPAPVAQIEQKPVPSLPANPVFNKPNESSPVAASSGLIQAGTRSAAKEVEIEFQFFSGTERTSLGVGRHHYISADGENYGVSVTQAPDLQGNAAELPWQLEISGRIGRQGLSPTLFQLRGALPERLMPLKDISDVQERSASQTRNGRMPDGILDRQSLLYHFMFAPPAASGGALLLTDGVGYALYNYRITEYESIRIESIGELRASKLAFTTADSPELIELWLVPEMHHLPVKVRHTDRRGVVTEQVAISLSYK